MLHAQGGPPLLIRAKMWKQASPRSLSGTYEVKPSGPGEVVAVMPEAVRRMLHARVAAVLGLQGGAPALVARHWQQAGALERAVPRLREAAETARGTLLLEQTASFEREAAGASEKWEAG
jgi:hypothetical protein